MLLSVQRLSHKTLLDVDDAVCVCTWGAQTKWMGEKSRQNQQWPGNLFGCFFSRSNTPWMIVIVIINNYNVPRAQPELLHIICEHKQPRIDRT